jgi:predicted ATPase
MLTRIEIDGFKTFEQFHLDLGPFVVVLGRNARQSNLFDAIRLLAHLAGVDSDPRSRDFGGAVELFRQDASGSLGPR